MTLATRRFLYITFILAFVIITPLVIAYAAGYELTLDTAKPFHFQKTGTLALDSTPSGAKIFINGKIQQVLLTKYLEKAKIFGPKQSLILTPAKIKNLLPGEYEVRFEKDGYWPWQKKLIVRGGESTYAEDVVLFKDNLPLNVSIGQYKNLSMSGDGKFILGISDGSIALGGVADDSLVKIKTSTQSETAIWSPSNTEVMVGSDVYNLDSLAFSYNIDQKTGINLEDCRWDIKDSRRVYCLDAKEKKSIKAVNLENFSSADIITTEKIEKFFIKDGLAYVIKDLGQDAQKLSIYKTDPQTLVAELDLAKPFNYEFINLNSDFINLYNTKLRALSLIDPSGQFSLLETINDINYSEWIGPKTILYNNNSEIWTYDVEKNQKSLLTRIAIPIKKVILHPSKNYVLFITDTSINSIELDDREKRNITELLKLDGMSDPFLNSAGDTICFIGKIGNQEGIYKLPIQ